ncbi:hypothetical protein ILUMI_23232 [Ignelater luminosus]|uniref:Major facilitator superfamily (MFS) profile domain-containing protein n=1 Tax=Ignelater luminosus TaxID=2038154 RepID=A0A8K0FZT2_IGNLU|nr:hypothetical protein ILUMI_23232 [Ignelater luminosus]
MDPISSSCFSLHIEENARAIIEEQKQDEQFSEIIVSCRSLSYYEGKKFKTLIPQILAATIAASFHIVVGISLAYSAILLPQLMDAQNSTDIDAIPVTESDRSWIASIIVIVAPAGAIAGGFVMDSIGRLNMIKLAAIPSALGWVLIATATNVPMLLTGRVLTGIASAWGTSPAIVYITEIARADMRGSLISVAPAYASLGMVLAYLKGWFLDWRLVAWLCNVYTILPVILIMFIPESPAWLVSKGRIEQARKSLEWIHKYQPQPEHKSESFAHMQLAFLEKEQMLKAEEQQRLVGNNASKKLKMFIQPTGYKPLLILSGLFFFQQFSGIYITLFYAVTFFKDVGTDINPYLASIFIGTVRFCMSMANTWLMRRYRRRSLLVISAAGMAVCMGVSGLYTNWIHEGTTNQNWVPVVMLLLYVVTSMMGLLSIPWTMTAELFPLAIRGVAHSMAYSVANFIMFASIQSYYSLLHIFRGSAGIQYFFAVISLGGLVYSFIFLPETHKKKLSEIEEYFQHHTTYFSLNSNRTKTSRNNGSPQRKPIVKNTRLTEKDFIKACSGQNEKMINNKV